MALATPKSKLYDASGTALGELVRMHNSHDESFAIGHINIAYAQANSKVYLDDTAQLELTLYTPSYF